MSKTLAVRRLHKVYQGRGRPTPGEVLVELALRAKRLRGQLDLPDERGQLTTRSDPRFTRLRTHVYAQIQQAKRGGDQTAPPSPEGATAAPGS